ncbi:flocculation protein FLO11-like [Haliotis rubra]|uniref:flocculation protein FLO11-like n=1 Tax=Haliotis rubra TaxID=36100 RepID=UPI001EE55940|nr:flocculation protein FLO11-like [Haliotis rubra]
MTATRDTLKRSYVHHIHTGILNLLMTAATQDLRARYVHRHTPHHPNLLMTATYRDVSSPLAPRDNVTLLLACDPGQYITIDAVLVGPLTSDCKVSKECGSPSANISQLPGVIACNGQGSCNASLQLAVTCNNSFRSNYAVEILYRCFRSSAHPISSEESTTESTMSSTERNMSPTESTSGSTLKPPESTSGRTMSPTDSMTGITLKPTESMSPTDSMTGSTNSPTESMTGRAISPTDFMTGSTMSPTESTSGSTLKSTESTSGSTKSPTESTTGSTLLPTESMTGSTMKPTESTSGTAMKPTESTSGSTMSTTKSTTESRTNASVHGVVVLLVLVGVMVFTTLLVTCLLCVYRKPWKKDQSSIVSPNTCTHLNHASAPVVANLYSEMTSGDENVVHMSSLENIGQMADSDHWTPLTVRQGHSAVKYSVSRVENGEGGCPGDRVYAQLDIPSALLGD